MPDIDLSAPPAPPAEATPPAAPDAPAPDAVAPAETAQEPWERKFLKQQDVVRRQERELRKYTAQMREAQTKLEELSKMASLLKEDPLAALEAHGHNFDSIAKRVLGSQQLTPEQQEQLALKKQLEALQQERDEEKKTAAQLRAEQARATLVADIDKAYEQAGETFACSAALGLSGELYNRLQSFVSENGYEPTPEDQLPLATELEEQARTAVTKSVASLIKRSPQSRQQIAEMLRALDAPSQAEPDQQAEKVAQRTRNPARPKTITREQTTAVESRKGGKPSLEERRRLAQERVLQRIGG